MPLPIELRSLRSDVPEQIYRSSSAVTDCHWSSCPTRASGPSVFSETSGGASRGATGPMPKQPVTRRRPI